MRSTFRFRLRTLLYVLAVTALAAGALRYGYDAQRAAHRRDLSTVLSADYRGTTWRWTAINSVWPEQFRRIEHLWCEEAEDLSRVLPRLDELTELKSLQVLARQIMPHAVAASSGRPDAVIAALRRHPCLDQIIVDASIRGAPLDYDAAPYTREDLAVLQAALPELQIVWIEVN